MSMARRKLVRVAITVDVPESRSPHDVVRDVAATLSYDRWVVVSNTQEIVSVNGKKFEE